MLAPRHGIAPDFQARKLRIAIRIAKAPNPIAGKGIILVAKLDCLRIRLPINQVGIAADQVSCRLHHCFVVPDLRSKLYTVFNQSRLELHGKCIGFIG